MNGDGTTVPAVKVGDVLELEVEKAAFEGHAIARKDGFVIFVEGAVPGDSVRARVFKKKRQYAHAKTEEVLRSSEQRIAPRCRHFGVCGGCTWQHLGYENQLFWKREHVRDAFSHIGGLSAETVHDTVPSRDEFFYRNKMEFTFGEDRWLLPDELGLVDRTQEGFALGLHLPGRYNRILEITECWLQSPESNALLNATREFFRMEGLEAFSSHTQSGFLRHLVIREAKNTGERMVFLLTSTEHRAVMARYATLIAETRFGVTTLVHGITDRKSSVAVADTETILFGPGHIRERLGACMYEISPSSFFQSNTRQAETLYDIAGKYARVGSEDVVWDLYAGTGTISLFLAPLVRSVLGVEAHPAAVADAVRNAERNGISSAEFIQADMLEFLREALDGSRSLPDAIIVDPPRSGLHPSVTSLLASLPVPRLVYISCNPATCARDCKVLSDGGFTIREIAPVDMFPHTYHIECVVRLEKRL